MGSLYLGNNLICPIDSENGISYHIHNRMKFQELEYIKASGNNWIDTGVKGNNDCEFNSIINIESDNYAAPGRYSTIFGCRNGGIDLYAFGIANSGFTQQIAYGDNYTYTLDISKYVNKFIHYKFNNTGIYIDNEKIYNFQIKYIPDKETNDTIKLFGFGNDGIQYTTLGYISMSKTFLYKDDILVRNFIPVKMNTGEIGMWDKVTNTFFGNKGSGSFIAGPLKK